MIKNKGFTLIELLVVFAVIGLLAGIILASVKSFRERANIAKTLAYSKSVDNLLAADAVGIWNFDEGSGTTVNDASGWGNNGTIVNGATFTNNTPYKAAGAGAGKYALSFDGAASQFVESMGLVVVPEDGAIAAWINGSVSLQKNENIYPLGFDYVSLLGPTLTKIERTGIITGVSGNYDLLDWGPQNLYNGNWHHYLVTWAKTGTNNYQFYLYLDGKQIGTSKNSTKHPAGEKRKMEVGRAWGSYGAHTGLIDEVRIFSRALSQAEIQKLYAEGAARHGMALK